MFKPTQSFSSFSTNDIEKTKSFYVDILGLEVSKNQMGLLEISIENGPQVMIYPKPDHTPATFTVLNFVVQNVESAVDDLIAKGIVFEQYPRLNTDSKGMARANGPMIAWFKDPAGNILSIVPQR